MKYDMNKITFYINDAEEKIALEIIKDFKSIFAEEAFNKFRYLLEITYFSKIFEREFKIYVDKKNANLTDDMKKYFDNVSILEYYDLIEFLHLKKIDLNEAVKITIFDKNTLFTKDDFEKLIRQEL